MTIIPADGTALVIPGRKRTSEGQGLCLAVMLMAPFWAIVGLFVWLFA